MQINANVFSIIMIALNIVYCAGIQSQWAMLQTLQKNNYFKYEVCNTL